MPLSRVGVVNSVAMGLEHLFQIFSQGWTLGSLELAAFGWGFGFLVDWPSHEQAGRIPPLPGQSASGFLFWSGIFHPCKGVTSAASTRLSDRRLHPVYCCPAATNRER
jgi:hypothetical protein